MFSRFEKIILALMVSLLIAGVSILAASAQDANPPTPTGDEEETCADCHEEFEMSWKNGPHGNATSDPIFVKDWTDQGKPSACLACHVTGYDENTGAWEKDGVYCTACHLDDGGDHPKTTMSVDATGGTCGTCHTDARFGMKEWEESTHFAAGMDCTTCHDPHNASLKITVNLKEQKVADASQLCISCHEEASMNFPYSTHSKQGVTCIDCHLEHVESDAAVHQVADHSFKASITTCNSCHANQMHTDGQAEATEQAIVASVAPTETPKPAAATVDQSPIVSPDPAPVSPLGYAGITALIGIAAGMLLAPWLERGYRLVLKKSAEVHHGSK
ncbi:MAG TPA: cytochrome c3 family protein [Anaerolineales bacterium]|nr:cytochrome c3 family protein [Anaerolineales bacterium]HNE03221.1 cytochrome c3 family protein [Anaerolineales bacterium]HNF93118.1 cytochrome c3 family protein [Anaerolineales bacterium]